MKVLETEDADDKDCARARIRLPPSSEVTERGRFIGVIGDVVSISGGRFGSGKAERTVLNETFSLHSSMERDES
jgi:hypothetical protein